MRYRRLGKTRLEVSVIGVGTWQFSGEWGRGYEQAEVSAIVDRARELGLNLIDTAECYGDHLAEELVGTAIRDDREHWVVATKFGHRFHTERFGQGRSSPTDVRSDHWSPDEVLAQLDASLRALQTDHVDVYLMHSAADEVFFDDALWAALADEVRKGRIRHLGVSLPTPPSVRQVEAAPGFGIEVVQVAYNRIDRRAEERVLPLCAEHDLGVLIREPLANGFLSGKYRPGAVVNDPRDWRSQMDEAEIERRLQVVAEVERSELPSGAPMAEWAIAWCLRHPAVSSVIPGAKSVEQLEQNAQAAELA
jgi:aryl-alcohol dehydrogenase-like predicted oxidoreductase